MSYYALLPAAGNGFRFGSGVPKQYSLLHGKPVLQHSIERLAASLPLAMTFVVSAITLSSGRVHLMQGAVHAVVFAAFLFLALVP